MNINDALDKAYESMSLAELVNAPVAALQGAVQQVDVFGFHTGSLCAIELATSPRKLVTGRSRV